MNVLKSFYLATILLPTFALVILNSGCELVTEFDRGKLLDGSEDANEGNSDLDTGTQSEDSSEPDTSTDGGIDGSDAESGVECTSPADCQASECQEATCNDNSCGTVDKERGVSCELDGGLGVCDGDGSCVSEGCANDLKDGDETGVDCGGSCEKGCGNGDECFTYDDCASRFCQGGLDPDQDAEVPETPPGKCAACEDDDDCDALEVEGWCDADEADGTCKEKKEAGSECDEDKECLNGSCKADFDGQGGWCADADECAHNGVTYQDGDASPDCYDDNNRAICNEGSWESDSCGDVLAQDSDEGDDDFEHAGTVTVYSACVSGACGSATHPDECNGTVLTEYGVDGVAAVSTEYDCELFEVTTCADNVQTTDEWACEGEPGRCVDATDTTEPCGTSGCSGTCDGQDCTYVQRGCEGNVCSETSQNPDDSQSYCDGCLSSSWLADGTPAGNTCCGDDVGEDFEQVEGVGRSCCYNAAVLASGSSSDSILCFDGQLYDCGAAADDDSGIAEDKTNCDDAVGGLFCTSSDTWGAVDDAGCSCEGNGNCTSNHCRTDWDDDGQFCAQDDTGCVYDDGTSVHQRANGWVECDGGDDYRVCTNGAWDASVTPCGDSVCNSDGPGCGYVLDAGNVCVSGPAGGCGPATPGDCVDCGHVAAIPGGCNEDVSGCRIACGSSVCDGEATADSGFDVCSATGDVNNRIDTCSVSGTGALTTCDSTEDGPDNDELEIDCENNDCDNGACQT